MSIENSEHSINDPQLDKDIADLQKHVKENEILQNEAFVLLKEGFDFLQDDIDYLKHITDSNDMADFLNEMHREEGYEKPAIKKYSEDHILEIKEKIDKIKKEIKEINDSITNLTIDSIEKEKYVDMFNKMQETFKYILTRIDPQELN